MSFLTQKCALKISFLIWNKKVVTIQGSDLRHTLTSQKMSTSEVRDLQARVQFEVQKRADAEYELSEANKRQEAYRLELHNLKVKLEAMEKDKAEVAKVMGVRQGRITELLSKLDQTQESKRKLQEELRERQENFDDELTQAEDDLTEALEKSQRRKERVAELKKQLGKRLKQRMQHKRARRVVQSDSESGSKSDSESGSE